MTKHIITIILLNLFCPCTNSFSQTTEIKKESQVTDSNQVFISIEVMPEFPGGTSAFLNYLKDNVRYPSEERKKGISGKVFVYFVINKEGKVQDARIQRGIINGEALEKEALRVINEMPIWSIGTQNNKPANVQFMAPIYFSLNN